MQDDLIRTDVTVIGGGLAGMASSIHLARAGLQVACIEPAMYDDTIVGESLDWSAPELLRGLGLPMDRLLADEIATWKRHVIVRLHGGTTFHYVPGPWLARSPWKVELRTLHVDRIRLREALRQIFFDTNAALVNDRVSNVERTGHRVTALTTQSGKRVASRWFIDASGSAASLFPRRFKLPAFTFGPRKVALWSYFDAPDSVEGTTLHTEGKQPPYMDWVWEIPIHPRRISVGYVAAAESIREWRQRGMTIEQIYQEQVSRIPRFKSLFESATPAAVHVTSFQCRAHRGVAGPNWLVVGEAAAMIDPMTSNGVTAALRTAEEASHIILRSHSRSQLPRVASALYSRRAFEMACFFNSGIEAIVYNRPVRNTLGIGKAGRVYIVPAWLMNLLYTRLRPRGPVSTLSFCLVLSSFRTAARFFHWLCQRFQAPSPRPAGLVST
jgi:flavin-dependent dehydrogenase